MKQNYRDKNCSFCNTNSNNLNECFKKPKRVHENREVHVGFVQSIDKNARSTFIDIGVNVDENKINCEREIPVMFTLHVT